jgi:predicted HTH transcriptional regulator
MESNATRENPWKENLDSFLKNPNRDNLRSLLRLESVEDNDLEFKRQLIPHDDIARHILAMSNKNGGAIVFGVNEVQDNVFQCDGLENVPDMTDFEKNLSNYVPSELKRDNFFNTILQRFDGNDSDFPGKMFLVIVVNYNPRYMPFVSTKEGGKLKKNTIYIWRNRASEPANHDEIQEILNKRIETEYSTTNERELVEHLEELKKLYSYIPKTIDKLVSYTHQSALMREVVRSLQYTSILGEARYETHPNPDYPKESYENFIGKLIEIKKEVIVKLLKSS